MFLYFEDKAGVKVNVKQRSSEKFCPSGTSCKEVGRPWSRDLPHPGLPAFCNSSVHCEKYPDGDYLVLHGRYRCLGFTPRNFYVTGLEWILGISSPGDYKMQLIHRESLLNVMCFHMLPV